MAKQEAQTIHFDLQHVLVSELICIVGDLLLSPVDMVANALSPKQQIIFPMFRLYLQV